MNPIIFILGVAAVIYLPTLLALSKVSIKLSSFIPTKITETEITAIVGLKVTNSGKQRFTVNGFTSKVYLNGKDIGHLQRDINVTILGNAAYVIGSEITLNIDNLGDELWMAAITRNLQNFVLEFRGEIWIDKKRFPFTSTWTIKDFVSGVGNSIGKVETISETQKNFMRYFGDGNWELVEPYGSLWNSRGKKLYIKSKLNYRGSLQFLERQNFIEKVSEAGGDNVICVVLK